MREKGCDACLSACGWEHLSINTLQVKGKREEDPKSAVQKMDEFIISLLW